MVIELTVGSTMVESIVVKNREKSKNNYNFFFLFFLSNQNTQFIRLYNVIRCAPDADSLDCAMTILCNNNVQDIYIYMYKETIVL